MPRRLRRLKGVQQPHQRTEPLPPLPDGYPRWVKYYADGGFFMDGPRGEKKKITGVYWSIRCEDGSGKDALVRKQDPNYRTNNDAEWLAVYEAFQHAAEHHKDMPVIIYSDSLYVVNQWNDKYRCTNEVHHRMRTACRLLGKQLKFVAMQWVPREVSVDKLGH